jgi:hypothetical protein
MYQRVWPLRVCGQRSFAELSQGAGLVVLSVEDLVCSSRAELSFGVVKMPPHSPIRFRSRRSAIFSIGRDSGPRQKVGMWACDHDVFGGQ